MYVLYIHHFPIDGPPVKETFSGISEKQLNKLVKDTKAKYNADLLALSGVKSLKMLEACFWALKVLNSPGPGIYASMFQKECHAENRKRAEKLLKENHFKLTTRPSIKLEIRKL